MALLLLASLLCTVLLLVALFMLNRYPYRMLRQLWSNKQRERLLSFADEFPVGQGDTAILGDTHVADFRWEECFGEKTTRNLGIPDETVAELAERLPAIVSSQPKRILLHCGGTDIRLGYRVKNILAEMDAVLTTIHETSPQTHVIILGVLPQQPRQAAKIRQFNQALAELATQQNSTFLALFDELADASGGLGSAYSADGYHLWGAGYKKMLQKLSGDL